jgi:hypothetical protein
MRMGPRQKLRPFAAQFRFKTVENACVALLSLWIRSINEMAATRVGVAAISVILGKIEPIRFEQNLVRSNAVKHRPSKGVILTVVCVPVAQISRILVVVGVGVGRLPLSARAPVGLRRRNARGPQYQSDCDDSGDLANHIVLLILIPECADPFEQPDEP